MKQAAQFALFVMVLTSLRWATAQNATTALPPSVQHFDPLVVVAFDEASRDPVELRGDMFSKRKEDRLNTVRAMGMDAEPELRSLWEGFLADHAGEADDKAIMQFISGGMQEWNFGDRGSRQYVLGMGFDELTDHPLSLESIFESHDGKWRHIATVACRCAMGGHGEPMNLYPGKQPDPAQELAVSISQHTEDGKEYHAREIRFLLRRGRLWPLIEFEDHSWKCTDGVGGRIPCTATSSSLKPTQLISEQGVSKPGFVVVTYSGEINPKRKVQIFGNPQCVSYLWDEHSLSYLPTDWKPLTCGAGN